MNQHRRELLKTAVLLSGSTALGASMRAALAAEAASKPTLPDNTPRPELTDITADAVPISVAERQARIDKAQRLLAEHKLDALLLEPGSAMAYFTGISWWRSERLTAVVIPREGGWAVVTPFFEEPSVRESMTFGDDVRTWHEHDNPFALVGGLLRDRGIRSGRIAVEASVRYFVVEGIRQSLPQFTVTGADSVTRACRMIKSPAEIALMRKANEVTLRAYAHVYPRLEPGMRPQDVKAMMQAAQTALGGRSPWTLALFGESSAYPHGSDQPQQIEQGQIVLMDCGCAVQGYQSDISRTFVFGEPTDEQQRIWALVREGQSIALRAARPGRPAEEVDDAVRRYYEKQGLGPGYQLPGMPHRTGHGIGMDGHEPINFVHGERTPLAPGMCFSNEPGIYLPGKFGVRLEDCLYITDEGPAWFTVPPDSLQAPIGRPG